MNDRLQKILADAKVGKAEFDRGSYYVCSEDFGGVTNVEIEIRKLYEDSN